MGSNQMTETRSPVSDLDRPGSHLEIPQRLGILPTIAFWKRPEVWRHGRWFVAPGVMVLMPAVLLGVGSISQLGWLAPPVGGLAVMSVGLLWLGFIEWVVRKGVRARMD